MSFDFYDLLDVDDDATQDEIKTAFRQQVRRYHPDHNDDERAPAQFTALKKGYDVLKDPDKRAAYDRLGHVEYVSKRMDGLPDPEKWMPSDETGTDDGSSSTSSADATSGTSSRSDTRSSESSRTRSGGGSRSQATDSSAGRSTTTGRSGSTTSSASASRSSGSQSSTARSSGRQSSGSGTSASHDASSTSRSTDSSSASSGRTASASATGASASATSGSRNRRTSGGARATSTGASRTRSATGTAGYGQQETGLRGWLKRFNVGWPLVFLSVGLYVLGLAGFAEANRAGVNALRSALVAAGSDAAAVQAALTDGRYGIETLWAFTRTTDPGVLPPSLSPAALLAVAFVAPAVVSGGIRLVRRWADRPSYLAEVFAVMGTGAAAGYAVGGLVMMGVVVLPIIFLVIVHITRQTNPRWTPNWGYVLCAAAPAVGLVVQTVGGVTGIYVDVVCYGVLPVLSIAALLASAGVRRVARAVREYRR